MTTKDIFEAKHQHIESHDNEFQTDVQHCMSEVTVR